MKEEEAAEIEEEEETDVVVAGTKGCDVMEREQKGTSLVGALAGGEVVRKEPIQGEIERERD